MLKKLPLSKGILDNNKLKALYEDFQALDQKVGTQPFALEIKKLEGKGNVKLFDEVVDVSGKVSLEAALRIHAASQRLDDLYGTGGEFKAPSGSSFADFRLAIGGQVGGEGSVSTGALTISANGSLSTGIDYRHVLPVKSTDKRLHAFSAVLLSSRPPQALELSRGGLADGEVHRLDAVFDLDFGLKLTVGKSFALDKSVELFKDLPGAQVKASGELAITAALGLAMYERMYVAIGRSGDWARVRLQREGERRIGFSAMMALQASYDFGGGLATILEQALDQSPMPRLLAAARAVVDPVAAGDWEQIKSRLTGKLADAVEELVDDSGWKSWIEGSEEVRRLLATSAEIVDFYDNKIGPTVHSLWDQLLAKADLGPDSKLRGLIAKLTTLDAEGFDLDDLMDTSGDVGELIDLIEALSGKSLEEILVTSKGEIEETLAGVAKLARKAEELFDLDDEIVEKIQKFAERTGIAKSIDALREMPANPQELVSQLSGRLRKVIERLAGKAWDEIDTKDLERIQAWAAKIQGLLQGVSDLEQEILGKIRDLRGEVGFSIGLELSRVSTEVALLDVEVDLGKEKKFRQRLGEALTRVRVRDALDILVKRAREEDGALPFRLRECLFTSRRVRTSAMSFLFKLLGPLGEFAQQEKGINRRVDESTLRVDEVVTGTGADQRTELRRSARYAAGFQRTEFWNKATSESAVWLEFEAADTGTMPHLEARFGKEVGRSLRATFAREDLDTSGAELAALARRLVDDLGFAGGKGLDSVPPSVETRLTVDIRLPGTALSRFCNGLTSEAAWNRHYLSAAHHWFEDRLVVKNFSDTSISVGALLGAFMTQSADFRVNWKKSVNQLAGALSTGSQVHELELRVGHQKLDVRPLKRAKPMPVFDPAFAPIGEVVNKRGRGFSAVGGLRKALGQAGQSRTPSAYREATRVFANAWRVTTAFSSAWPTPTFGFWLLRSRLSESDTASLLAEASGTATLRWQENGEWQGPVVWRLVDGQGLRPSAILG